MRVSLRQVVDELECLTDESTAYLNRETGELYSLGEEETRAVEDGVDVDDLPEWLADEAPKIREILASESWLCLPTRFDIHEWAIMDAFAHASDDPDTRSELLSAIRGKGAFRYFKDVVCRRGLEDGWYRYRVSAIARIATEWLDEHGIAYTSDQTVTSAAPSSHGRRVMEISPIGVIHSPHHTKDECPIQPAYAPAAQGRVEVFPDFAAGLKDLELFTHIYLLYAFDRAGDVELVRTTFLDDAPHGVFSSRHPCRPNGIGLSIVRLLERRDNVLVVSGIDVLDETPLLDIKPYVPKYDVVESASNGWASGLPWRPKPSGRE